MFSVCVVAWSVLVVGCWYAMTLLSLSSLLSLSALLSFVCFAIILYLCLLCVHVFSVFSVILLALFALLSLQIVPKKRGGFIVIVTLIGRCVRASPESLKLIRRFIFKTLSESFKT